MTSNQRFDRDLVDLLGQAKPTLAMFGSEADTHSLEMMPVLDSLRNAVGSKANVVSVNGPQNEDLLQKYHIHSYPTFILFKDGQEVWRDGGRKPLSELEDMVNRFV